MTGAGATTALKMYVTDEEGFATATESVDFARIRLTVQSASNSEQQQEVAQVKQLNTSLLHATQVDFN